MKKNINNKGFAISTLLYGLLVVVMLILTLIISTMAYNRSSTKSLISEVISDLELNHSSSASSNPSSPTTPSSDDITAPIITITSFSSLSLYNTYSNIKFDLSISDSSNIKFDSSRSYGYAYFNVVKYPGYVLANKLLARGTIGSCNSTNTSCKIVIDSLSIPSQECGGLYACNLFFEMPESVFCDEYNNCTSGGRIQLYNFN